MLYFVIINFESLIFQIMDEVVLLWFSEEESRQRIKELTQRIQSVRQEKVTELARRAEVIAYQKDQLQEAKAKAQLEITYEKKKCENHLEQVRERCYIAEQEMRREQDVRTNPSFFCKSIFNILVRH